MAIFKKKKVDSASTDISLKETEGMSQGEIIRRRFFRHRGAMISMVVLIGIMLCIFSALDFKLFFIRYHGWWKYSSIDQPDLRTSGCSVALPGCPTLSLVPGKSFGLGDHPFGQDDIGRDYFALVMRGAQRSVLVMFIRTLRLDRTFTIGSR